MPIYDRLCVCGWQRLDCFEHRSQTAHVCPNCGAQTSRGYAIGERMANIVRDEIPGGFWNENLGPEPIRFDSKSEMRAYAKSIGLEPKVEHVPEQGTDKNRYTTNWATGPTKEYMESIALMLKRVEEDSHAR